MDKKASENLKQLVSEESSENLGVYFDRLTAAETSVALSELSSDDQTEVINTLSDADAARVFESIPEVQAAEIASDMAPEDAARIIDNVESDEQADILAKLPENLAAEILSEMDPAEANDTIERLKFPPSSAGGLMVTEILSFKDSLKVRDVVESIRESANEFSHNSILYIFVVSSMSELLGVLKLRDLLLEPIDTPISKIMLLDPISVDAECSLIELEDAFNSHRYMGIPVTDSEKKLIGVVRRADVEEAIAERSESNFLKTSGILGGEELRSMPLFGRSKRRLTWLSSNIVLNIIAASVISFYQETLQAVIALAIFLPIISDMSGCSGAQSIAVTIREMSLGLARPKDILKVLRSEMKVGLLNGLALGSLIALAAWLWNGNHVLGLVVGAALAVNTFIAVCLGGVLPLILKKLGKDPALASGPILTTVTDMIGFWLVLSLASFSMPWLI